MDNDPGPVQCLELPGREATRPPKARITIRVPIDQDEGGDVYEDTFTWDLADPDMEEPDR